MVVVVIVVGFGLFGLFGLIYVFFISGENMILSYVYPRIPLECVVFRLRYLYASYVYSVCLSLAF